MPKAAPAPPLLAPFQKPAAAPSPPKSCILLYSPVTGKKRAPKLANEIVLLEDGRVRRAVGIALALVGVALIGGR